MEHRADVIRWLEGHPRVEFIQVDYPTLVREPESLVPEIVEFLGDKLRDPGALASVIDRDLYRNRERG